MARNDDNAKNWSMGDMQRDQEELELSASQPYNTEEEANKVAKMLRSAAVRNKTGAKVEVKKERSKRGQDAYVVKVYTPKKK